MKAESASRPGEGSRSLLHDDEPQDGLFFEALLATWPSVLTLFSRSAREKVPSSRLVMVLGCTPATCATPPWTQHCALCSISTHYLHNIYTISSHYLLNIYSISTQYLHTIYSISTQYLHTIYTVSPATCS